MTNEMPEIPPDPWKDVVPPSDDTRCEQVTLGVRCLRKKGHVDSPPPGVNPEKAGHVIRKGK